MKYRVVAITKSGVHDELQRSEMAFGMLGTTSNSNYNHLVQNISASRDVQRNCNVIVTPLLGFGARLTHLPLHKHPPNLHRDFIFP